MRTRLLGRSGIEVSELGLGGLFVASFATGIAEARSTVARALDLGVTYIDTAPTYGDSETVLGKVLAEERRPLVLSTKLGGRPTPFDPRDPGQLRASFSESLRLLGRDSVDLLMIHEPDRPGQYDWWTDWGRVLGPVLEVVEDLKAHGLVRAIGIGGTTIAEMTHIVRCGRFDVLLTAFNLSLLYREALDDLIPSAKAAGMGVVVGSPLQQGLLARRRDAQIASLPWISRPRRQQLQELYRFLDESGLSLPDLGLRYALNAPGVDCVLVGARTPGELEEAVAATERGPLPPAVLARLDAIAAMVPFRPCAEPFSIGWAINDANYRGPGQA